MVFNKNGCQDMRYPSILPMYRVKGVIESFVVDRGSPR